MEEQIVYRLANDSDINAINGFYNEVYKKSRTYEEFYWEFNSSPAGKAIYVIALFENKVIGSQCAIPYYLITGESSIILSAKSEDTLVSPKHRGKNIFENMYKLLIEECKKSNIKFLWGFTYANKPFQKIGFEIPFKSTMGLLTIKPFKAADYFYSITATKGLIPSLKIKCLSLFSYLKFKYLSIGVRKQFELNDNMIPLNSNNFNYIKYSDLFGLQLDTPFIDYRIKNNPYSRKYQSKSYYESGRLKALIIYNITKENVGFILHLYFDETFAKKLQTQFIKQVIHQSDLKECCVVRYWGFTHNVQNKEEVDILKACQFLFLKRGISFVGLNIIGHFDFSKFVLSRLASQGTD